MKPLIVRCKRCGDPAPIRRNAPEAQGFTCARCQQIVAARKK
jgi:endogenous inhibitor of DNA gyrase (YacG/DUF329 family)